MTLARNNNRQLLHADIYKSQLKGTSRDNASLTDDISTLRLTKLTYVKPDLSLEITSSKVF